MILNSHTNHVVNCPWTNRTNRIELCLLNVITFGRWAWAKGFHHISTWNLEWYCVSLCVIDAVFILLWSLLHVMLFVIVLMCFYLLCNARYEFCCVSLITWYVLCAVRSKRLEQPPVVWEPQ